VNIGRGGPKSTRAAAAAAAAYQAKYRPAAGQLQHGLRGSLEECERLVVSH